MIKLHSFGMRLVFALCVTYLTNGCDGTGEQLFNCNNFPVKLGEKHEIQIPAYSGFITHAGGAQVHNVIFMYPDGSLHYPREINANDAFQVQMSIRKPGYSEGVKAVCKKFGPGLLYA